VIINNIKYEKGIGKNKKSAEQEAAMKTLNSLLKEFK
jgi:dsRNA-specific ribonuclease